MEWLNYHHLLYFWVTAKEGSLTAASRVLRLARPTLSGQIHTLEERLGEKLFAKSGRNLVLTDVGRVAFRYADEIFTLGRELVDTIQGRSVGAHARLDVGIVDAMPKLVVRRLLEPALHQENLRLVCHEDSHERLLARLAAHELDVVLADAPVPAGSPIRVFNHVLGDCGVTFFASGALAALHRGFPRSLDGAPFLLPMEGAPLRRALDAWFEAQSIRPRIVAEFEDSALLKVFGGDGIGVFVAPTPSEREVQRQYGVKVLGRVDGIRERFYAITVERRLKHPAVVAISDAARQELLQYR
ncbi:MAG: transcriptional activator NhaR [Deltaproteobacteria bacterium]|nr:transcriptional activator NhaR [Deltaproteobacteria bacterium]